MSKTAIVVTTIFEPRFLDGYLENLRQNDRAGQTTIYVIVDKKTPPSVESACASARADGFDVRCPTLSEQEEFLASLGVPDGFIPWNTDNRRNVGFLMALVDGVDFLVSIDDDNYIIPGADFVGGHHVVGQPCLDPVATSSDAWFNVCDLIDGWQADQIFARGFPYHAQRQTRTITESKLPLKVGINAGLWLSDPDVDAIYRLGQRPLGTAFRGNSIVLSPGTWTPVNTQNTALTRELALCYYYVRMGFPLRGLTIDRFGDILSGYLTQKVAKHLGQGVRVGTPVVDHRRTQHNLFKDLYHELAGIVLVEEFVPWLIECKLSGTTSLDSYASLAEEMYGAADQFRGFIWDDGGRDFLKSTASHMLTWHRIVSSFA